MTDYRPIDCNFHDRLLHHATLREEVNLRVRGGEGEEKEWRVVIRDVYTEHSEEYALLSNGERVRLDRIIGLNGMAPGGGFCQPKPK